MKINKKTDHRHAMEAKGKVESFIDKRDAEMRLSDVADMFADPQEFIDKYLGKNTNDGLREVVHAVSTIVKVMKK